MIDIPASLFFNFFIFLFIPFIFAYIIKRFKISPLVGYILGGIVLGNVFSGAISKEVINNFAYFGIILLLFTAGLEINFQRMMGLKKFIVVGGALQLIFSIILVAILSLFFRLSPLKSLLIGIAFSSSSTAIVAKIIQERGEENSFIGEIALGILMFQDIAFIPFFIIFSSITGQVSSFWSILQDILSGMIMSTIIICLIYFFGQKIVPIIFDRIAKISRELLNLFIILFIFFISYLSTISGIPILIGVFLAGILLAQTMEHYHIFSQIRPMRDLLAIIFFVYIGTNIKLLSTLTVLPMIVWFSLLVILIKALVILVIFLFFRFNSRLAFSLAIFLFQIDEDAFILMSAGFRNGVFNQNEYLFIISSVLLTLIITPVLINEKDKIYQQIRNLLKKIPIIDKFISYRIDRDQSPIDVIDIKNHVIICGYGRVGRSIGRALLLTNIPFIAIDYDFHTVEKAKKEGVNIIYGDPSDIDILDYAQAEKALVIISAVPERFSQESIILNAKKLNKNILIITRVHRHQDHRRMKDLGANVIVQPEIEASLAIIKKIFILKHIPKEEIVLKIKRLKMEEGII